MKISQKQLKDIIVQSKKELVKLEKEIKEKTSLVQNIYSTLTKSTKDLQKICKHKNVSTRAYMRQRRMDYMDWEEPAIAYTCLDCDMEY